MKTLMNCFTGNDKFNKKRFFILMMVVLIVQAGTCACHTSLRPLFFKQQYNVHDRHPLLTTYTVSLRRIRNKIIGHKSYKTLLSEPYY